MMGFAIRLGGDDAPVRIETDLEGYRVTTYALPTHEFHGDHTTMVAYTCPWSGEVHGYFRGAWVASGFFQARDQHAALVEALKARTGIEWEMVSRQGCLGPLASAETLLATLDIKPPAKNTSWWHRLLRRRP